jgi:hypothetical protein
MNLILLLILGHVPANPSQVPNQPAPRPVHIVRTVWPRN